MMAQPCFLAVEKNERMSAKSTAPSTERKPPEIFWRKRGARLSVSARLRGLLAVDKSSGLLGNVSGRQLSIPLLRYPIAGHLPLYGVGARPPPEGVR